MNSGKSSHAKFGASIKLARIPAISQIDQLTGLLNRRWMVEEMTKYFSEFLGKGEILGVIAVDIDHLKKFNDRYGYSAGDQLVRHVGFFLKETVPANGVGCRWGGEEFLIALRDYNWEKTSTFAEELRKGIEELEIEHEGETVMVTASFGTAVAPRDGSTWDVIWSGAFEALYRAKENGRNRVEHWHE